jgi:hypothetical protein
MGTRFTCNLSTRLCSRVISTSSQNESDSIQCFKREDVVAEKRQDDSVRVVTAGVRVFQDDQYAWSNDHCGYHQGTTFLRRHAQLLLVVEINILVSYELLAGGVVG